MDGYVDSRFRPPETDVLLAALEASGEAILVTTADLDEPGPRIEYVNPAFTRMTGYSAHEVIGRNPRLLQGPRSERAVLDELRAALVAGSRFQGETLNYRKDGSTYVVEWLITPVRGPCGKISRWVSAQRDVTERRAAEDRQGLLVRELHHRVKNTLATVQAVLNSTLRSTQGPESFRKSFSDRISSLARTHALITEEQTQSVSFRDLIETEFQPFEQERSRVVLTGPAVMLSSKLAVPVGMALHELATNAVTHGALREPKGRVEVAWTNRRTQHGPALAFTWNEHDGPPVALPTREGFGSQLLKRILTTQIDAEVDIAFDPDGLRVKIVVPL